VLVTAADDALCRRRWKRSITRTLPKFPSLWRSIKSISRARCRAGQEATGGSRAGAGRMGARRLRRCFRQAENESQSADGDDLPDRRLQELKATPGPRRAAWCSKRNWIGDASGGTILVQNGTLHAGDNFVVGTCTEKCGDVRRSQQALKEAPPSTPVEIIGLEGLPQRAISSWWSPTARRRRHLGIPRAESARSAACQDSRVSLEGLAEQLKMLA